DERSRSWRQEPRRMLRTHPIDSAARTVSKCCSSYRTRPGGMCRIPIIAMGGEGAIGEQFPSIIIEDVRARVCRDSLLGGRDEPPPPSISASGRGRGRAAGSSPYCKGASLSGAAGAVDR